MLVSPGGVQSIEVFLANLGCIFNMMVNAWFFYHIVKKAIIRDQLKYGHINLVHFTCLTQHGVTYSCNVMVLYLLFCSLFDDCNNKVGFALVELLIYHL